MQREMYDSVASLCVATEKSWKKFALPDALEESCKQVMWVIQRPSRRFHSSHKDNSVSTSAQGKDPHRQFVQPRKRDYRISKAERQKRYAFNR